MLKLQKQVSKGIMFIRLSGDLAGSGGLSLHLLGLDKLVNVSSLLSLGQALEVKITNCNVYGIESGFIVQSTHDTAPTDIYDYTAAGFVARSNSTKIENSHVHELYCVLADNEKVMRGDLSVRRNAAVLQMSQRGEILAKMKITTP